MVVSHCKTKMKKQRNFLILATKIFKKYKIKWYSCIFLRPVIKVQAMNSSASVFLRQPSALLYFYATKNPTPCY